MLTILERRGGNYGLFTIWQWTVISLAVFFAIFQTER